MTAKLDGSKIKFYLHNISNSQVYTITSEHVFGRSDDSDIVLDDENISLKHFKAFIKDNQIYIQDLNSSNGTCINGMRISSGIEEKLREGDSIAVGKLILQISSKEKSKSLGQISDLSLVSANDDSFFSDDEAFFNHKTVLSTLLEKEQVLTKRIDKLEFKETRRKHLESKILGFSDDLDDQNLVRLKDLELYYKENKLKYEGIIAEIPKVEAKLKLLKLTAKNMETLLDERKSLKALERKQSKYQLELKDIKRDDHLIEMKKLKAELKIIRKRIDNEKTQKQNTGKVIDVG